MVPPCLWAKGCHCRGAASTPPLASHMDRGSVVFSEALGGSQAWDFRTFVPGQAAQGLGEVPAPLLRSSKLVLSLPQLNLAQEPERNLDWGPWTFPVLSPSRRFLAFPHLTPYPISSLSFMDRFWYLAGYGWHQTLPCQLAQLHTSVSPGLSAWESL